MALVRAASKSAEGNTSMHIWVQRMLHEQVQQPIMLRTDKQACKRKPSEGAEHRFK